VLQTKLKHLEAPGGFTDVLAENEKVMICCGRMGPMCIPVYRIMERLEKQYPHVAFRDMDFDIPEASAIRNLPECASFSGLPFTVYFKKGQVVAATSSIQTEKEIIEILERVFE
jgi:thioredoxin 1